MQSSRTGHELVTPPAPPFDMLLALLLPFLACGDFDRLKGESCPLPPSKDARFRALRVFMDGESSVLSAMLCAKTLQSKHNGHHSTLVACDKAVSEGAHLSASREAGVSALPVLVAGSGSTERLG